MIDTFTEAVLAIVVFMIVGTITSVCTLEVMGWIKRKVMSAKERKMK